MITQFPVATTPEIDDLLARNAVVAFGVSGGKDSVAGVIATHRHLERIGHTGPRVAIHADLGRVEWSQSLFKCQEVAANLGWEFVVVNRAAGDMMDRWLVRWENNVSRYQELSCVQLILPWSTPAMRFCTSELKTSVIRSALKKRFPMHDIVNATGVRREESPNRAKAPVAKYEPQATRKGFMGYTWNPILEAKLEDVWALIASRGLEPHEAYTKYALSRVSCVFCVMSSAGDLYNSSTAGENLAIYREMVDLEVASTFAFQSGKWLADVNPGLLASETLDRLQIAKRVSAERKLLGARIPAHLLYTKGWPTCIPTLEEAGILADVRCQVAAGVGIEIKHTDAASVVARFEELMEQKFLRGGDEDGELLIPVRQISQQQHLSFL